MFTAQMSQQSVWMRQQKVDRSVPLCPGDGANNQMNRNCGHAVQLRSFCCDELVLSKSYTDVRPSSIGGRYNGGHC